MKDLDLFNMLFADMAAAFERGTIQTEHGLEWEIPAYQGYGVCSWSTVGFNVQVRAHRVAWMLENGPISEGYVIDHDPACPKTCVTIAHLQCLTISDHIRLGWERGELNGGWGTKRERIHPPSPEPFAWQTERRCKNCDEVFMPTTAKNLHCSRECHYEYKTTSRKSRRYPRPGARNCAWMPCGTEFAPKRKDSMFCSRKCIDDNQNYKKKVRKEAANVMS